MMTENDDDGDGISMIRKSDVSKTMFACASFLLSPTRGNVKRGRRLYKIFT
jgi:ABC-type histidine transport system ATPase subunit